MIVRERITGLSSRYFNEMWGLYQASFPEEERRDMPYFLATIAIDSCHLEALLRDGRFVGMLCWWKLDSFCYIEYLATDPSLRGGGLGKEILQSFIAENKSSKIVLEVEHPESEINCRRIGFYERLGFVQNSEYDYSHPCYTRGSKSRISLLLMSLSERLTIAEYESFCRECFSTVHF